MAIYDMKCPNCGLELEVFCKIEERNSHRCPCCFHDESAPTMDLLMSTPKFTLSGDGVYKTGTF